MPFTGGFDKGTGGFTPATYVPPTPRSLPPEDREPDTDETSPTEEPGETILGYPWRQK